MRDSSANSAPAARRRAAIRLRDSSTDAKPWPPPPKKRKTAAPPSFSEGDRVECFFRDWEQYFPATISRMNDDLSYGVDYDDRRMRRKISRRSS